LPNIELLNAQAHRHLRLLPAAASPSHFVQILVPEFGAAAVCCPILFTKDGATGAFYAGALFGFKPGENLLGTAADRGGFEPLILRREGFFMADSRIAIDRDHARFADPDGEPLFDEAGEPAKPLRTIQRTLGEIHAGAGQTKSFIEALTALMLIEPIDVSLNFGGERVALQGLYTVSLDRLRDLDDAAVVRLFREGHLQLAYTMAGSLKHIGRLAGLRQRRP
jgi:hypothetical protein